MQTVSLSPLLTTRDSSMRHDSRVMRGCLDSRCLIHSRRQAFQKWVGTLFAQPLPRTRIVNPYDSVTAVFGVKVMDRAGKHSLPT
ncbi:hypothetical protein [Rhodanobacter glycinis]|nr:hypothetical protein [Rhodanobacter glycinis]